MGKVAEVLDAAKRAACETCLARTESGEENVLRQAKAKLARERHSVVGMTTRSWTQC